MKPEKITQDIVERQCGVEWSADSKSYQRKYQPQYRVIAEFETQEDANEFELLLEKWLDGKLVLVEPSA